MPTYYNNGHGGAIHSSGDITHNTRTTNHIYLAPHTDQGEYDSWMRKVGSLMHVAYEHSSLKPILDLLAAMIEPERIFLLSHPAITSQGVKPCVEIILVVDSEMAANRMLSGFLKMACFRQRDVILTFHSATEMEDGLNRGHTYYMTHCREENLVFSGSSYRLPSVGKEALESIKVETQNSYDKLIKQVSLFFDDAKNYQKKQSSNLTALRLHQCLENLYKAVTYVFGKEVPKTGNLLKLSTEASKFIPQLQQGMNKKELESLEMVRDSLAFPDFEIDEFADTQTLYSNVGRTLNIVKTVFDMKMDTLFGQRTELQTNNQRNG